MTRPPTMMRLPVLRELDDEPAMRPAPDPWTRNDRTSPRTNMVVSQRIGTNDNCGALINAMTRPRIMYTVAEKKAGARTIRTDCMIKAGIEVRLLIEMMRPT